MVAKIFKTNGDLIAILINPEKNRIYRINIKNIKKNKTNFSKI